MAVRAQRLSEDPLLLTIIYGLIALLLEWPLLYFYCDDLDLPPQLINHNDL
jgi:hypothetical protein